MTLCMQVQMEAKDTQIQQQDTELQEKTAQINKQQTEEKELQKLRVRYCNNYMVDSKGSGTGGGGGG